MISYQLIIVPLGHFSIAYVLEATFVYIKWKYYKYIYIYILFRFQNKYCFRVNFLIVRRLSFHILTFYPRKVVI